MGDSAIGSQQGEKACYKQRHFPNEHFEPISEWFIYSDSILATIYTPHGIVEAVFDLKTKTWTYAFIHRQYVFVMAQKVIRLKNAQADVAKAFAKDVIEERIRRDTKVSDVDGFFGCARIVDSERE